MIRVRVDRFSGSLLGGALGDALGYPLEFVSSGAAIVADYGASAPRDLCFSSDAAGLVSDDTQMTLFTADALIRTSPRPAIDRLLAAYQRWYGTQAMRPRSDLPPRLPATHGLLLAEPRLHARRAPGTTCMSALARSFMLKSVPTTREPPNHSKGCGAVMRSAPIGLAAASREEAFELARDAAVLTHGHPSGYLSAAYFASLVFDLARDARLDDAMREADARLAREPESDETRAIIDRAQKLAAQGPPTIDTIERLGGGWTGEEALAIALLCTLTARDASPESTADALWRSVAHGGDSDSTGSLTGNLLGAMHGEACLPARWLDELEMRELIARVAQDLWARAILGAEPDEQAYPPQRAQPINV